MLAHPAFDHRGDRLHGALNIDPALGIPRRLDGFGEVGAKAMAIGQAYHARSKNRAFDMACETGNERVGFARAAEECHVDAANVILIDQDPDMRTAIAEAPNGGPTLNKAWGDRPTVKRPRSGVP